MAQEASIPRDLYALIQKMIDRSIAAFARSGFLRNARITGGAGLTIAEGGDLTVADGGGVAITGGGDLTVAGGGGVRVSDGGNLDVDDGGGLRVGDGGKLTADYPIDLGGGTMLHIGRIVKPLDRSYQGTGMLLQAPDGTDMMVIRTDAATGATLHNIYDSNGVTIFGNDPASGQGMARPYLAGGFAARRFPDFRYATSSTTFETLCDQWVTKQQPELIIRLRASMDTSGTTGELRVLINGVQFGPTFAETFAVTNRLIGPLPVAGAHMSDLLIEIQGRRTSTTGFLRMEPVSWKGRQSS